MVRFNEDMGKQIWVSGKNDPAPSPEHFSPVENYYDGNIGSLVKPAFGGFWTSTYTPDDIWVSDWIRWCMNESYFTEQDEYYLLEPSKTAKLLEVDTLGDLRQLNREYHLDDEVVSMASLRRKEACLDFEAMADDGWDGLHLTEEGQWNTRMTEPNLYGWDAESTVWFNWKFEKVEFFGYLREAIQ